MTKAGIEATEAAPVQPCKVEGVLAPRCAGENLVEGMSTSDSSRTLTQEWDSNGGEQGCPQHPYEAA